MAESERIDRLADRLIAAIPKLDPRDQTVAVALTRMCWPRASPSQSRRSPPRWASASPGSGSPHRAATATPATAGSAETTG